jgi:hypothetical protein
VSPAERWLRERLADAPPELLEAMIAALPGGGEADADAGMDGDGGDVAGAFVRAGTALYARVLDGCGDRRDALPLLAADALFTHALQVGAEAAPGEIAAFARRMMASVAGDGLAERLAGRG